MNDVGLTDKLWDEAGGRPLDRFELALIAHKVGPARVLPLFRPDYVVNAYAWFTAPRSSSHRGFACLPDVRSILMRPDMAGETAVISMHVPRKFNRGPGLRVPSRAELTFYGGPAGKDWIWAHGPMNVDLVTWRPSTGGPYRDKLEFRMDIDPARRPWWRFLEKLISPRGADGGDNRASGFAQCQACGKMLIEHAPDYRVLGYHGDPFMTLDCLGNSWKL